MVQLQVKLRHRTELGPRGVANRLTDLDHVRVLCQVAASFLALLDLVFLFDCRANHNAPSIYLCVGCTTPLGILPFYRPTIIRKCSASAFVMGSSPPSAQTPPSAPDKAADIRRGSSHRAYDPPR